VILGVLTPFSEKHLEEEHKRLKNVLAEVELDEAILKEALRGN
jgi:hypothetical protein